MEYAVRSGLSMQLILGEGEVSQLRIEQVVESACQFIGSELPDFRTLIKRSDDVEEPLAKISSREVSIILPPGFLVLPVEVEKIIFDPHESNGSLGQVTSITLIGVQEI